MNEIIALAAPYGPFGLLVTAWVWRESIRDKREEKRDERIEGILRDSTESNKDLTVALTVLAERVRP